MPRAALAPAAVLLVVAALGCRRAPPPAPAPPDGAGPAVATPLARVTVDVDAPGVVIPKDFVGLSMEYGKSLRAALGHPTRPNETFFRLLANLPASVLRVGGNSTDESCYEGIALEEPGTREAACHVTITAEDLDAVARAAEDTGWRFILGVNQAQASPAFAAKYAEAVLAHVPRSAIYALEIGNEPDLYPTHALKGAAAPIRAPSYDVRDGAREYAAFADAIRKDPKTAGLSLAGPAMASKWAKEMATVFLPGVGAARIDLVTTHHYPLSACREDRPPADPRYPTIDHLLAPKTMQRLAEAITLDVAAARSIGKPLEIDETNSISCAGTEGVSDTFASAAWGLDYFFTAASLGAARLNLHGGSQTARYSPITPHEDDHAFTADVHPLYYAMLLFSYAEGATLVPAKLEARGANLRAWAVAPSCAGACPALRVFLLDEDDAARGDVRVVTSRPMGHATVISLRAPAVASTSGVTLGGHSVDTATGEIGSPEARPLEPDASGAYVVDLDVAEVVMLSIDAR